MSRLPISTRGIVLRRTNYGEADRIMTLLTPDYGKVQIIAKGVRKEKSRLAGGIELFSVSSVSFVRGRSDITTLVSSQLLRHYDHIVGDYERTMIGYDFLKWIDKITEDSCEEIYFDTLQAALMYLNEPRILTRLSRSWFISQLLAITGHEIDAFEDSAGNVLNPRASYIFDREAAKFLPNPEGDISSVHIKVLRLLRVWKPERIMSITQIDTIIDPVNGILESAAAYHLGIKQ